MTLYKTDKVIFTYTSDTYSLNFGVVYRSTATMVTDARTLTFSSANMVRRAAVAVDTSDNIYIFGSY